MRLDKFLVEAGIGSRTEVKQLLKKKQVTVNGEIKTSPQTQIDEKADHDDGVEGIVANPFGQITFPVFHNVAFGNEQEAVHIEL